MSAGTVKVCSCGRPFDHAQWMKLPFAGVLDGDGEKLDLRNCSCHSTIALELPESVSVCTGCGRWLGAGEPKVCGETSGVLCDPCAETTGVVVRIVRIIRRRPAA
ncbi:MAG TPA: hypothetical protein VKU41_04830 [Polyangiaceae bacterium]|nr:hypothetical protein [Polyangiaceae bacterium]